MPLPADEDLIARDSALGDLRYVLDAGELKDALGEAGLAVGSLRCTYLRYKHGVNCLAGFEARANGIATDLYAVAYRRGDERKAAKDAGRGAVGGPLGIGRVPLRPGLVVAGFPNDGKLAGLRALAEPARRDDLLAGLLPADGGPRAPFELTRLTYKPERRFTASLTSRGEPVATLKVYTAKPFEAANRAAKAFRSVGMLSVPQRLGRSTGHRVLALGWKPGLRLEDALGASGQQGSAAAKRTGAALAELHRQRPKGIPIREPRRAVPRAFSVARELGHLVPSVAAPARRVARAIAAGPASARPKPRQLRATHGDFHTDQVVLQPRAVGILDMDRAAWGMPAEDVANFVAHLERDRLLGRRSESSAAAVAEAFVEGYGEGGGAPTVALAALTGQALFGLALDPFRLRMPDWPDRTRGLLERAQALLGGSPQGAVWL